MACVPDSDETIWRLTLQERADLAREPGLADWPDRDLEIADEISELRIGQVVHIDDHEIEHLAGFETEVYAVDGMALSFYEAWAVVTERAAPRA